MPPSRSALLRCRKRRCRCRGDRGATAPPTGRFRRSPSPWCVQADEMDGMDGRNRRCSYPRFVRQRRTVHSEPTTPDPMRIDAPVAGGPARSGVFDSIESVSWLELFYDLVMVAAIIVFSHGLSAQPTWETALRTMIIFSVLWWVWLITTLLVNA